MNRIQKLLSLLTIALMAPQCTERTVFHTGTFEGETYKITSIETKGFSNNSIAYELKLGSRKAVAINANTTDWGPPYTDDLYGTTPRVYVGPQHAVYQSVDSDSAGFGGTMVYLSPERFSRKVFDEYARFMTQAWPAINEEYADRPYTSFRRIIGLVYGNQDAIRFVFTGEKEGQKYTITVEPDGRIQYAPVKQYANYEYSGLSAKVHMPGKCIYVSLAPGAGALYGGVSMSQLATYRDATGKTLADYFTLLPDPAQTQINRRNQGN